VGHVFLSYHRPDAANAKRIRAGLNAAGYDVWWDEELPTHRTFHEVIEERLRSAEAVVVLWSKDAPGSDWVRAEADLARKLGKIVQATSDGELPPIPFNQIQCAKLDQWNGSADHSEWIKVLDGVRAVAGRPPVNAAPTSANSRRRFGSIIAGASLLVVLAIGVYWATVRGMFPAASDPTESVSEPRIAVLPFEPIGRDPKAADFAAALADAVAGSLSENSVQTLPVSRAAEFEGDRRVSALKAIGANLALGGSVRRVDERISVRAYFEDVDSGYTVWSTQFERRADQEALLLSEVAAAVTETAYAVSQALEQRDVKLDPQTLSLYLKLNQRMLTPDASTNAQVLTVAEQVVARSPEFAAGHGALALLLAANELPSNELERAHHEADKAISLFAATGVAYDALYRLARLEAPTDLLRAEAELARGLDAAPRFAFLQMRRCEFLLAVGRIDDSLRYCEQAAALRPLAAPPVFRRVLALWFSAQDERAWRAFAAASAQHPNSVWVNVLRFLMLENAGRDREMAATLIDPAQRPYGVSPEGVAAINAYVEARATHAPVDVETALRDASAAAAAGHLGPAFALPIAVRLGKVDQALEWLAGLDVKNLVDEWLLFLPGLEPLRKDPRFMTIAARTGLIDYWRKTDAWPDFCADATLPYDCRTEAAKALPSTMTVR
jgi:adenylate cyclase